MQALSVDTKLHKLFDPSRHEGKNEMDFQRPADVTDPLLNPDDFATDASSDMSISSDGSKDLDSTDDELHPNHISQETASEVGDFVVEDGDPDWEDELMDDPDGIGMVVDGEEVGVDDVGVDDVGVDEDNGDEINMDAYDTVNVEKNGLIQTEQAGVVHLVHRWTMRGHPNKVGSPLFLFFAFRRLPSLASCLFQAMRHQVVRQSQLSVLTIISRSPWLVPSHRPSRRCSLFGMMFIKRPSRLASGLQTILALSWVVPSFINCKAGFIGTATMWDHLFLFPWASTLVVK